MGGQRNERRKWISHFQNVNAVCFLASLADYDHGLLEDGSVNRFEEDLKLFKDVVTCP